ncbi:hypothetical protein [Agrococcus sp. DT81.2]|uniref:hypothetical protein n=1 Tax=Agrococcus sp. DT81.2 TaxID=3393414 RepID=UPI003CE5ADC5
MGWFGALIAYLALDVVATAGSDVETVKAAYVAMALLTDTVILPAAAASVLVGTLLALGSRWGLLQHYWVLIKLLLTVLAATVLVIEASSVRALAVAAGSAADPRDLTGTLPHSIGGLVVLTVVLVLSVVKPRGLTRYGWRRGRTTRPTP